MGAPIAENVYPRTPVNQMVLLSMSTLYSFRSFRNSALIPFSSLNYVLSLTGCCLHCIIHLRLSPHTLFVFLFFLCVRKLPVSACLYGVCLVFDSLRACGIYLALPYCAVLLDVVYCSCATTISDVELPVLFPLIRFGLTWCRTPPTPSSGRGTPEDYLSRSLQKVYLPHIRSVCVFSPEAQVAAIWCSRQKSRVLHTVNTCPAYMLCRLGGVKATRRGKLCDTCHSHCHVPPPLSSL